MNNKVLLTWFFILKKNIPYLFHYDAKHDIVFLSEQDHLVKLIENELDRKFYSREICNSFDNFKIKKSEFDAKSSELDSQDKSTNASKNNIILTKLNKDIKVNTLCAHDEKNIQQDSKEARTPTPKLKKTNEIMHNTHILKLCNEDSYLEMAFEEDEDNPIKDKFNRWVLDLQRK